MIDFLKLCGQLASFSSHLTERASVFRWKYLDEFGAVKGPVAQDFPCPGTVAITRMPVDKPLENCLVRLLHVPKIPRNFSFLLCFGKDWFNMHHRYVASVSKTIVLVQHVGGPTRHSGREITPCHSQYDHC